MNNINSKHKQQVPILDSFSDDNIKIFALGGLGEVGKNMYILECQDEIIIIDAGIMFPDYGLGIDYVIPDYTYLKNNQAKIKGLFITHGHEDHIGGIPHLLRAVKIPIVYAAGIAVNLIEAKMSEFTKLHIDIEEFTDATEIKTEHFSISFFRTNHSIPDSYGIAINTRLGYIIHTGDFKFDFTPLANHTDYYKLTEYGKKGVLCLLSDSTNALVSKFSSSEKKISDSIKSIFSNIKGRVIISTFASNVYRVQQIIEASVACGRKIIVFGRSMEKTIRIALKNGYINVPESAFISVNDFPHLSDDQITIISTGSQGEPLAALSRMANKTHKQVKIQKGDTIIFSSSAIPGNQESINRTINHLYKAGASVITNSLLTDTHTSGHASEAELQLMLSLVKPTYFVPIHGEYAMQKRHSELAVATGVKRENCFLLENGKVLTFNEKKTFSLYAVRADDVFIDEDYVDIDSSIIKERRHLSEDGLLSIVFSINKRGELIQIPNIITRGFIYMKNTEHFMRAIKQKGENAYNTIQQRNTKISRYALQSAIINEITSFIYSKTERKPMIIPIFMNCS